MYTVNGTNGVKRKANTYLLLVNGIVMAVYAVYPYAPCNLYSLKAWLPSGQSRTRHDKIQ